MQVLSVVCILTLVLYLLMVLALNPRTGGRVVFRTVYATIVLGVLSGLFYAVVEAVITAFAAYIPPEQNILRTAFALLMLLIPVNVGVLLFNMALKQKRPMLLLIATAVIDLVASSGVLLFTGFGDVMDTNSVASVLTFLGLYLPYLLAFAANGLLTRATKAECILLDISLYLNLALALGYLIFMAVSAYDALLTFGISGILPLMPFILGWLAVPIIPLLIERRFKNQDAIRHGQTARKLFFKKSK